MLRRYRPLWMFIHFNHSKEITAEVERALALLADAGIPLGSQTVLLAGVNDCPNVIKELVHKLVRNRVRPYYLYQCDLVSGAGHFCTPVAKGLEVVESLYGHTSGFAVPTYVVDAPGGGCKAPVVPHYLISWSPSGVTVRNFEGSISIYAQPTAYTHHDPTSCLACQRATTRVMKQSRQGIASSLANNQLDLCGETRTDPAADYDLPVTRFECNDEGSFARKKGIE
jgi:lysine 2,3-aminomutase